MRTMLRDTGAAKPTGIRQVALYVHTDAHSQDRILLVRDDELGRELIALAERRLSERGAAFSKAHVGGGSTAARPA